MHQLTKVLEPLGPPLKVYLASSWRNTYYADTLRLVREEGYEVYDFRGAEHTFRWEDTGINPEECTIPEFKEALRHDRAREAFSHDFSALISADVVIGVAPFGSSTSVELGYARGCKSKAVAVYYPDVVSACKAELMWSMFDKILHGEIELLEYLKCNRGYFV